MDYSKLSEVTVTTQKEMDAIPLDFRGRIYIKANARIVVSHKYCWSVEAWDSSSVEAWGNSSVAAHGNSSVEAYGNSSVAAYGNSSVAACGNSSVAAYGNSSVAAYGNSSVEAYGNSSVEANANVQVVDYSLNGKIKVSGNARIVYMPKSLGEFMDFYGIKHTKTKAVFYKAVHKSNGEYISDHDSSFKYVVGGTKKQIINTNENTECGEGIHIAHLDWALNFGREFKDLAILEVETKIADIVCPKNSDGKVRTSCVKVLREVPLEECGLYGKILARRRK